MMNQIKFLQQTQRSPLWLAEEKISNVQSNSNCGTKICREKYCI